MNIKESLLKLIKETFVAPIRISHPECDNGCEFSWLVKDGDEFYLRDCINGLNSPVILVSSLPPSNLARIAKDILNLERESLINSYNDFLNSDERDVWMRDAVTLLKAQKELVSIQDAINKDTGPECCPYCGDTESFEYLDNDMYGSRQWHCHKCDRFFDEDDLVREPIRHEVSHILIDTNEDNQVDCDILVTRDKKITKAYQIPGDGTIWFKVDGLENGDDGYVNFDYFSTEDLKLIRESLKK